MISPEAMSVHRNDLDDARATGEARSSVPRSFAMAATTVNVAGLAIAVLQLEAAPAAARCRCAGGLDHKRIPVGTPDVRRRHQ